MNEEASIGAVLDEVLAAFRGRDIEIVIVDTDSRDRTRDIATGKGARVVAEPRRGRSEEHTSELQSLTNLVCRLLLEKKNRSDGLRRLTHRDLADPPLPSSEPAGRAAGGCPQRFVPRDHDRPRSGPVWRACAGLVRGR